MSSSSSIPKEAVGKINRDVATAGVKKRKRLSPFRIKVGCVVALRYQSGTGNHVTMIVPPDPSTTDDSPVDNNKAAIIKNNNKNNNNNNNKPTKHPLLSLVGLESHVEVWTDPIPGRDEGLALIGRRVRCCFTRAENSNALESAKSKNGSSKKDATKKTKNFIVEGEVVSILNYFGKEWREKRERQRRKRGDASFPSFAVELLIDRDVLAKVSFLERTDEDVDINQLKKESAKRAHRNEEAIKGKNKVTVRVNLADPSGVVTHAENNGSATSFQPDVAKWAVRKRIPNKPGQPLAVTITTTKDLDSAENEPATKLASTKNQNSVGVPISDKATRTEKSTGTSDNKDAKGQGLGGGKITNIVPTKSGASSGKPQLKIDTTQNTTTQINSREVAQDSAGAKKKRQSNGSKKSANAPTQFLGDGNDDPVQQQRNWRWLAARYYDMFLANLKASQSAPTICNRMNSDQFYAYYSELLASCGGLVGEVLEVTPSSRAGTLAMVTIRRLILPEHTAAGRLALHNKDDGVLQIFDDYDSTLIDKIRRDEKSAEQNCRNGHDDDDSHNSVLFRVPIEQLVIVSRQIKRDFQNQAPDPESSNVPDDELCVSWSYSLRSGCRIPLKCMVSKSGNVQPVPRPLNKKKLRKLCLCHRCRTFLPQSQATVCDNENCMVALHSHPFQEESAEEDNKKCQVIWCEACLNTLRSFDSISIGRSMEVVPPSKLPCCAGWCDCRQCQSMTLPEMTQNRLDALTRDSASRRTVGDTAENNTRESAEDQVLPFSDVVRCALPMSVSNFDLPQNLIELSFLPTASSKPVTKVTIPSAVKKRKKASSGGCKAAVESRRKDTATPPRKKLRASSPRPRTPPPMSGLVRAPLRRMPEDYTIFKPSCSRLLDYKTVAATKALHDDSSHHEPQLFIGHHGGDKPRNLRELEDKSSSGDSGDKDEKTTSSRALRANQRRLVKDVALLGASSLSLDTLAGRESQLRFDRSGIHAWGVFADGEISAGDMIVEYRGELIGNAMAEKREREYEQAKIGSDYMFRIDGLTVCDATKQGNVARFINASCDPNCYTKIIALDGKQRIVIYAKKDIKAGEELCYDYKFPIEYDESKRIPCYCGARECRGYMNWDKRYVAMPAKPNGVWGSLKAKSALGQGPLLPIT